MFYAIKIIPKLSQSYSVLKEDMLSINILTVRQTVQRSFQISKSKAWPYPPFFVTLAHHFDNGLGGHAISLSDTISKFVDQKKGLNSDITPLGIEVIKSLLSHRQW